MRFWDIEIMNFLTKMQHICRNRRYRITIAYTWYTKLFNLQDIYMKYVMDYY